MTLEVSAGAILLLYTVIVSLQYTSETGGNQDLFLQLALILTAIPGYGSEQMVRTVLLSDNGEYVKIAFLFTYANKSSFYNLA